MLTSNTVVAYWLILFVLVEGIEPYPLKQSADGSKVIAFVDVHVVPMDRERILERQTVLVRDGRVAENGSTAEIKVPDGAMRIDGGGKYLMPGPADMHVHLYILGERSLLLFIANGVTTVRGMWGTPEVPDWRQRIAGGEMLAPTIYTSGALLDGKPSFWPDATQVESPEEAERVAAEQKTAGYDYIKVYGRLSAGACEALVTAAGKQGIRVVGHVPGAVGLDGVVKARQSFMAHLEGYIQAIQSDDSPVRKLEGRPSSPEEGVKRFQEMLDHADLKRIAAVAGATRDAGEFLNGLNDFETVTVGQRADLILGAANPLVDVANAGRRAGVMVRGKWFPESTLQRMLDERAASYGKNERRRIYL